MVSLPIYLDHNATTPCDAEVVETMLPYFTTQYGNAASRHHAFGWVAHNAAELAREQVSALINCEPNEVVFTSGATESVNLAIKGVFDMYATKGQHIITCVTEHKAVLDVCKSLEKKGAAVTYLPVNQEGIVDVKQLEAAIRPDTILIAIMYANNETGTLQPVKEIGLLAKKHHVIFFCDATQAVGKIDVDVLGDEIDLLACSAHKMYGPKGVGALYLRRKQPRVRLVPQMDGGGHEKNFRSGTLNVPGIVGFGKACVIAMKQMNQESQRLQGLRNKLEHALLQKGDARVNGSTMHRLPHVTNISFSGVDGQALMMGINKEIAVSSGSACTSASLEPSYVLSALGLSDDLAYSSLRFSLGRSTSEAEIDYCIQKLSKVIGELRQLNPVNKFS